MSALKNIAVGLILLALAACSDNKISMVKNGTLEFDKSLTLGQAIDNYKYFKETKWEALTTENEKQIVQVTGAIDLTKHPTINLNANPELKSAEMRFQFVINQDETFDLAWCGFGFERTNGEKVEPAQQVNLMSCIKSLEAIYNNSPDI